jgi:hypothetical protein
MVNTLGTPCYKTKLVYVLIEQLKLKTGKINRLHIVTGSTKSINLFTKWFLPVQINSLLYFYWCSLRLPDDSRE